MKEEFKYKTLVINRNDFEDAPCPMNCDKISDKQMKLIAKMIYENLCSYYYFGKEDVDNYFNKTLTEENNCSLWNLIDEAFLTEEEELFVKFGGVYYEDMEDE